MGPKINGGRVEAIAVPSGNSNTVNVGMASGSLWKTVNTGITWKSVFTHQPSFAIGDVAVAPGHDSVVLVGTGEAQPRHNGYAYAGTGVYKSVDFGATWQHMGLTDTHYLGKVLIDPRNPDRVFVGAMGHFWNTNADRGVFRTTDGGAHWEKVLFVDDTTGVVDMALDPSNPDIVTRGLGRFRRGGQEGCTRWKFCDVRVAPDNPDEIFILGNRGMRSADGGRTYQRIGERRG